jgi:hypothetical protein
MYVKRYFSLISVFVAGVGGVLGWTAARPQGSCRLGGGTRTPVHAVPACGADEYATDCIVTFTAMKAVKWRRPFRTLSKYGPSIWSRRIFYILHLYYSITALGKWTDSEDTRTPAIEISWRKIPLRDVYLWWHVQQKAPSFVLWWSKLEILVGPPTPQYLLHRRAALSTISRGTQSIFCRK